MSILQQIRDHYVNPANLGAELTLKQISAAVNCDNDKRLGIELWGMVNRSRELITCGRDAEGKNIYRWNEKRERAAAGGGRAARKKAAARPGKSPRKVKAVKPRKTVRKAARKSVASRLKRGELILVPRAPQRNALWALRQDGAFVLLGTQTEIPRGDARALVEFVRLLDRGEASA